MPLAKIVEVSGKGVVVPGHDIDTDRIIPARFMKCVTFDGLGAYLFHDVRFAQDGTSQSHPLDAPRHKGAKILFSGRNFGCGSSREHAPQALQKFGISAVVAESFAEIFAGNCTTLGIPCVMLPAEDIAHFAAAIDANPDANVVIDLATSTISVPGGSAKFTMKSGASEALMKGEWDALGLLVDGRDQVDALAAKLGYTAATAVAPAAAPEGVALISIDDFGKVKLATAEVISAAPHPKADRLLVLQLKVGEKSRQIVSGIRQFYTPEQMVGKTVIIVDNLQPAKLRGVDSFGMLLAVRLPDGGLRLLTTDGPAASGLSVS